MLTDIECRNALPKQKPYKVFDSKGLYLEVRPNGSKYWRLKYYFFGREKRVSLGVYPRTSLLDARKKQEEAKDLIDANTDPSLHRFEQKILAAYKNSQTFELVAREWLARRTEISPITKKAELSERYGDTLLRRMELDIFPYLGHYPFDKLTVPVIYACLQKIEKRQALEMAKRALSTIGQVFRYATVTGRADRDITIDLKGALRTKPTEHHAAIEIDELPQLVRDISRNEARLFRQTILAIRFLLLTFVRTSELIQAERKELDLDNAVWTIPAGRMKMRNEHVVPLSTQAVAIINEILELSPDSKYLFPSIPRPQKHMSNNTILKALERLKYKDRMTGHGFRALASSTLTQELGWEHKIVDLQLAHKPKSKTEQAYFRAKFLPQRTKMMQQWGDYIASLEN